MISAETATFMKWGGLGMVASELAESFNACFGENGHFCTVVTPLYLGNTGKKKASLENGVYCGAENNCVKIELLGKIPVKFMNEREKMVKNQVEIFSGEFNGVRYIFLACNRYFSINPHKDNPPAQDGCYILNEFHIDEVERFAFFSKAVFCLLENICKKKIKSISLPNSLIANDWHSGAIAGLTRYFTSAQQLCGNIDDKTAETLKNIPIIHIAHHLGYQGWD